MSALGQKRTLDWRSLISAIPPKADIAERVAAGYGLRVEIRCVLPAPTGALVISYQTDALER
jgi:hypothetical protein